MKDKVILIQDVDPGKSRIPITGPLPIKGEIYTVKEFIPSGSSGFYELVEINWTVRDGGNCCFAVELFRPVDDSFGEWVEHMLMPLVQIEELQEK